MVITQVGEKIDNTQNSPTLVISMDDKVPTGAHVVSFQRTMVEVYGQKPVKRRILTLLGGYYILDFEYPHGYSVMLKFLQHFLLGRMVKDMPKSGVTYTVN